MVGVGPVASLTVPDGAFEKINTVGDDTLDDDPKVLSAQRKGNARERAGQSTLRLFDHDQARSPAEGLTVVEGLPGETIAEVEAKERAYSEALQDEALVRNASLGTHWCAAFFSPKRSGVPAITTDVLHRSRDADESVPGTLKHAVDALSDEFRFFHWDLAFPAVFERERPGFDLGPRKSAVEVA